MGEVEWIKVSTDMFNKNRKIKQMELMDNGDTIIVIWFKLMLLAGNINDGGAIYLTPSLPYTEKELANELRRPEPMVKSALDLFEMYGMIDRADGFIQLCAWEKYQNVEGMDRIREQNRLRKQKQRDKQKCSDDVSRDVTGQVTPSHATEKEGEEERDKDKEYIPILSRARTHEVAISETEKAELEANLLPSDLQHYIDVIKTCERKGKPFKKSHYQAIKDMATQDGKYGKKNDKSYDLDDFYEVALNHSLDEMSKTEK